jgi:hypothetical protein
MRFAEDTETALGGNLPPGTKAIDAYHAGGGIGISIKSIDAFARTYRTEPGQIASIGKSYVNDLVNYRKAFDTYGQLIKPQDVSVYVLRLAYPAEANAQALRLYAEIVERGRKNDIIVQLVPVQS